MLSVSAGLARSARQIMTISSRRQHVCFAYRHGKESPSDYRPHYRAISAISTHYACVTLSPRLKHIASNEIAS